MKKLLTLLFIFCTLTSFSQSFKMNANEDPKEFVARLAPKGAHDVKLQLKDNLNTSATKFVYTFYVMEAGNIVKDDKDSSKCVYVCILAETAAGSNDFTLQTFKTNCNYRNAIALNSVAIITIKKEKRLQADVTEVVRGPGGLLRNVTRNYVYEQKKEGENFSDNFVVAADEGY